MFFWQALLVTLILAAFVGVLLIALTQISEGNGLVGLVLIFVIVFAMILLSFWIAQDHDPKTVHKWKGGAGANTVCDYRTEDDVVVIGKVITNESNVYTVCRDPS